MAEAEVVTVARKNTRRKRELRAQRRGLRTSVTVRCDRFEEEYARDDRHVDFLIQNYNLLHERLAVLREIDDQLLDLWDDDELDAEVDSAMTYQQRADDILILYRTLRAPATQGIEREGSIHRSRASSNAGSGDRREDGEQQGEQDDAVGRRVTSIRNQSECSAHTSSVKSRPVPTPRSIIRVTNDDQGVTSRVKQDVTNKCVHARVKLPKLELKPFNGDLFNWQPFSDHFTASVIKNVSLSDVDRLLYLKLCCSGTAYNAIAGVCATNANFQIAWDLLKRQFGRKRTLIQAHIEAIQHLKPLTHLSQVVAFRQLYSDVQRHLSSLERLDTSTEAMSAMLVPCILKVLPLEFAVKCERSQTSTDLVSVRTLMDTIRDELEAYEQVVKSRELRSDTKQRVDVNARQIEGHRPTTTSSLATNSRRFGKLTPCVFCDGIHKHTECPQVTTPQSRRDVLRRNSRCFRCLGIGHMSNKCPQQFRTCMKCKGKHHISLCDRNVDGLDVKFASAFDGARILLQTLSLQVEGENSKRRTRVLLDPGSQVSFIESDLAQSIGAQKCGDSFLRIDPFGTKGVTKRYTGHSVQLLRLDDNPVLDIFVVAVPTICSNQQQRVDSRCLKRLQELRQEAADQPSGNKDPIRVLIGLDHYWQVVTGRVERIDDRLTLVETVFGWVANGLSNVKVRGRSMTTVGVINVQNDLEKFWSLEHLGIKAEEESGNDDETVLRRFEETIERDEKGRYVVRLPWNHRVEHLQTNETGAITRLRKLLDRLKSNPKLEDQYRKAMQEYINEGFVEQVTADTPTNLPIYYLPHHAVVKEERTTTKVRVVFDASAHGTNSPSLNDCLHVGPCLLPDLASLLIRFRFFRVAFVGDIAKAFLQITLSERDRDAVRLLWVDDKYWTDRDGGDRLSKHRITLRKTVVLFGAGPSPFLLNATIKHHVRSYSGQYPEAVIYFALIHLTQRGIHGEDKMVP